jgi:hypothetical protein
MYIERARLVLTTCSCFNRWLMTITTMGNISTIFIQRWITTLGNTSTAESKVLWASLSWIFMVQMEPFFLASHWRNRAVSMIGGESDYWDNRLDLHRKPIALVLDWSIVSLFIVHWKLLAGPGTLHLKWWFNCVAMDDLIAQRAAIECGSNASPK